jgi:hypothetical protein
VIGARGRLLSAPALVLLVTLGACTSNQPKARRNATTTLAPTTTVLGSTTTPSPTTAAPPTTGVPGGCPGGIGAAAQGATQAARCFYDAWKRGDRAGAAVFASLDAVDALFRQRWSPPDGAFKGCSAEPDTGGQACRFEYHAASYLFSVQPSEGGWRVTQVST